MESKDKKVYGRCVLIASFLAVFCLFGYRSSFSIMQKSIINDTGWTTIQTSLGYCLMMTIYAITAFFSGSMVDKKGTRSSYIIGAICCFLGFFLTSILVNPESKAAFYVYLCTYGLFAGVGTGMLWVSSTISCRKWYVGAKYGTTWGIAFCGAPLAQLLLTIVLKPVLNDMGWKAGMKLMAVVCGVFLIVAALLSKKNPDEYGLTPNGIETLKKNVNLKAVTLKEAFSTYAIWADIICFLAAIMGEFVIWSQLVGYFQTDMNLDMNRSANIYMMIGLFGLFMMPLTGKLSDFLVKKFDSEIRGRKTMLIIGPACGAIGVALCLTKSIPLCVVAMLFLSIYWGIEPGGCAGYAGSIFGGAGLGRTWGLATLIVMGIGPSCGTFVGAWFKDNFGSYVPAFIFCLIAYLISMCVAFTLPSKAYKNSDK